MILKIIYFVIALIIKFNTLKDYRKTMKMENQHVQFNKITLNEIHIFVPSHRVFKLHKNLNLSNGNIRTLNYIHYVYICLIKKKERKKGREEDYQNMMVCDTLTILYQWVHLIWSNPFSLGSPFTFTKHLLCIFFYIKSSIYLYIYVTYII